MIFYKPNGWIGLSGLNAAKVALKGRSKERENAPKAQSLAEKDAKEKTGKLRRALLGIAVSRFTSF